MLAEANLSKFRLEFQQVTRSRQALCFHAKRGRTTQTKEDQVADGGRGGPWRTCGAVLMQQVSTGEKPDGLQPGRTIRLRRQDQLLKSVTWAKSSQSRMLS